MPASRMANLEPSSRPRRIRTALVASAGVLALLVAALGCDARRPAAPKVIVLGFDGLDYDLTRQMIDSGRLPAMAQLARRGGFSTLGTTVPPQSPVAWSNFITGLDAGGHGIFDFVHRDPEDDAPYLSTSAGRRLRAEAQFGQYKFPFDRQRGAAARQEALLGALEAAACRPRSSACLRTSRPRAPPRELTGWARRTSSAPTAPSPSTRPSRTFAGVERVRRRRLRRGRHRRARRGTSMGPTTPSARRTPKIDAPFTVYSTRSSPWRSSWWAARSGPQGRRVDRLGAGQFDLVPMESVACECALLPEGESSRLRLYVTPSTSTRSARPCRSRTPLGSRRIWRAATGRFDAQGMPEDTKALSGASSRGSVPGAGPIAGDGPAAVPHVSTGSGTASCSTTSATATRFAHDVAGEGPGASRLQRHRPVDGVEVYEQFDRIVGETLPRWGGAPGRDVRPRLHELAPRVPPEQLAQEGLPHAAIRSDGSRPRQRRLVAHAGLRASAERSRTSIYKGRERRGRVAAAEREGCSKTLQRKNSRPL